mmetsp:Transcript_25560/g.76228  ORF Transcript_25560/g.76228 Transcript_25560/m.76228 type:complete len:224 (+) Transcript_25560:489-1160(+)
MTTATDATSPSRPRRRGIETMCGSLAFSTTTAFAAKPNEAARQRPHPRGVSPTAGVPIATQAPARPRAPPSRAAAVGLSRATRKAMSGVVTASVFQSSVLVATLVPEKEAYHAACEATVSIPRGSAKVHSARAFRLQCFWPTSSTPSKVSVRSRELGTNRTTRKHWDRMPAESGVSSRKLPRTGWPIFAAYCGTNQPPRRAMMPKPSVARGHPPICRRREVLP